MFPDKEKRSYFSDHANFYWVHRYVRYFFKCNTIAIANAIKFCLIFLIQYSDRIKYEIRDI